MVKTVATPLGKGTTGVGVVSKGPRGALRGYYYINERHGESKFVDDVRISCTIAVPEARMRVWVGDSRHRRLRATGRGVLRSHICGAFLLARIILSWCAGNASCVAGTRSSGFLGPPPRSRIGPWVALPQTRKYGENRTSSSGLLDF